MAVFTIDFKGLLNCQRLTVPQLAARAGVDYEHTFSQVIRDRPAYNRLACGKLLRALDVSPYFPLYLDPASGLTVAWDVLLDYHEVSLGWLAAQTGWRYKRVYRLINVGTLNYDRALVGDIFHHLEVPLYPPFFIENESTGEEPYVPQPARRYFKQRAKRARSDDHH